MSTADCSSPSWITEFTIAVCLGIAALVGSGCQSDATSKGGGESPADTKPQDTKNGEPAAAPAASPVSTSERIGVAEGRGLYAIHCIHCHGTEGRGDGINSSRMNPPPADLTSEVVANKPDATLLDFIASGAAAAGRTGGMPPFRYTLSEYKRRDVVLYVRALQRQARATAMDTKAP